MIEDLKWLAHLGFFIFLVVPGLLAIACLCLVMKWLSILSEGNGCPQRQDSPVTESKR